MRRQLKPVEVRVHQFRLQRLILQQRVGLGARGGQPAKLQPATRIAHRKLTDFLRRKIFPLAD